jgi:hypothetical protein
MKKTKRPPMRKIVHIKFNDDRTAYVLRLVCGHSFEVPLRTLVRPGMRIRCYYCGGGKQ